ncbi:MAG: hypothetical protein ACXVCX_10155, partial [Ktedonobacterales bacterium]
PPCIDAGLYWIDEPERVSFQRAGEYLILERGLQFSGDIVGGRCTEDEARSLATLAHAPEKEWSPYAAASDDELLHLLADPAFFVRDIRFVGIQRAYAKSEKTKRLPHKVGLSFDVMSEEAIAHGDHAALQVYWSEEDIHLSSALFTDVCRRLRPTYAYLEGEGVLDCLYDMVHGWREEQVRLRSVSYCDDSFLGSVANEYWSTFTYTERLENGTFGSDSDAWWNRRWKPSKTQQPSKDIALLRRRNELFGQAVKRAYRIRFGKAYSA